MCGRLTQQLSASEIATLFDVEPLVDDAGGHYNVAPTQNLIAVVAREGERVVTTYRWGLVPAWAKDIRDGARMINARAETVAEKPAFRAPFRRHRCIIPAGAYYEWQRNGANRIPHAIVRSDGAPLAFAGLWSSWQDPTTREKVQSCAIITTSASEQLRAIHDRMPVILAEASWEAWLDPAFENVALLQSLLEADPALELRAYPVSSRVNNVRNDGPDLLLPCSG